MGPKGRSNISSASEMMDTKTVSPSMTWYSSFTIKVITYSPGSTKVNVGVGPSRVTASDLW